MEALLHQISPARRAQLAPTPPAQAACHQTSAKHQHVRQHATVQPTSQWAASAEKCQPACTSNSQVQPYGDCGAAVKDGCGGACELKCSSKSQCMFGTKSFAEVGVCVPFPEPTTCYGLGLPPPIELGSWNDSCRSTPIGGNCTATCPDKYQPGSSGPPTVACTVEPARGLVWGEPVGSCERVNDAPSFIKGASTITVNEDSAAYSSRWAGSISAGPNEAYQTVSFAVACSNAVLFSAAPQLSPAGVLSFTPAANASGSSVCKVTLVDSEGAKSAPEQLTVVVKPVNDPPSFTAGPIVTVAEDSGAYSATWATDMSAGPGESQPLAFTLSCFSAIAALFTVAPAMDTTGRLSFTPGPDMFGSASCTVRLTEQEAGDLLSTAPLTIVVTPGEAIASSSSRSNSSTRTRYRGPRIVYLHPCELSSMLREAREDTNFSTSASHQQQYP
uniref:Cadherin domain-containing protein n=1 Tax=Tetradesmus obliquus TaxID=3088 RepID=A0A383W203_TETOB